MFLGGGIFGRQSPEERILSYNIGLGLHDVVYASKIYQLLENSTCKEILFDREADKFWI